MSLETAARIIEPIRARAMECGYAIAIHGTLDRDIDLIAIPWVTMATSPEILLQEVCKAAKGRPSIEGFRHRPHGRLVQIIHLEGVNEYIDFSILPRRDQ